MHDRSHVARLSRAILCLVVFGAQLFANPPSSEWQIITPAGAGNATGSAYFPMQNAFDGVVTWDAVAAEPDGTAGANGGPPYPDRVGYIDFGPDYDEVHIMECWSRYRSFSGGSHPGYAEMWWDDDIDTVNDNGVTETRLNFNSGQGVPNLGTESWYRDKRINDLGGVRPPMRYLMLKSTSTYADRAQEYAIVGFLYDGLVPPEYANLPRLEIDQDTVVENTAWKQSVGTLAITGGEPGETYRVNYDQSQGVNDAFRLEGMTLWTTRSFDYEARAAYQLQFQVLDSADEVTNIEVEIRITDQTGAFDTNGVASAAVAAAYPEINEGDFVIWNATNSSGPEIRLTGGTISVSPPNKILIKAGNFSTIVLNLAGVNGTDAATRVPITNFLGQVYTRHFSLSNGSFWRLTGKYDPVLGLGHADFPGCVSAEGAEDFSFSNGCYGIWVSNEWVNESGSLVQVGGSATGWEVDHLECSDGGFAGMLLKRDNNDSVDMDDVYLHHLYIHDTGSEGIYLGSTQPDPQHKFNRLLIEDVLILRTGTEALQAGQLGAGSVIRNSVFWGALDWMSPFQRYQDNCAQVGVRQGGVTFENNILMGGGEKFFNNSVTAKAGITPNGLPLTFQNNVMWGCRGPFGAYQFRNTDNTTPWVWQGNFWGGCEYSYDVVYPNSINHRECILMASNGTTVNVIDNVHDDSRDRVVRRWAGGDSVINESGTAQKTVLAPRFLNLLGKNLPFDILKWSRWTATIGEEPGFPGAPDTNKGVAVVYQPGDIVQHDLAKRTRFYRCLQTNSEHEPPLEGDGTWKLLVWSNGEKTQFCPPDDARLVEGSFYHQKGMGFRGTASYDGDADDLPDHWEERFGLSLVSNNKDEDLDGDGRSNYEEFLVGSNPLVIDSAKPARVSVNNGDYELDWTPPSGKAWKYQYSSDLENWFDLTPLSPSDSPLNDHSASAAGTELYFRSHVESEDALDLEP